MRIDFLLFPFPSVVGSRLALGSWWVAADCLGLAGAVGFLATEFPTQYLAQHLSRIGRYLGVNIMIWGLILGCHAACTSFAGLAVARTLLGVFESWYSASFVSMLL